MSRVHLRSSMPHHRVSAKSGQEDLKETKDTFFHFRLTNGTRKILVQRKSEKARRTHSNNSIPALNS
uniref:Uncharacterized protein n=1 Tax=Utricularia reniformis TaxID=192314 RepID=A0A1Y0AZA8_9LAMI|nr:hypothetical protein AEK19_MT0219 [Utricularia reniformis]ART30497.1 hypothetical protein AEK19_MT0219 [Utricularia reniformis]